MLAFRAMDELPAVEATGLVRNFGKVRALDGLDLSIHTGEILGLVGPNGSGKTTFIRVVAGLLKPNGGRVTVLGAVPPNRRIAADVGYMTQASALYEDLPLADNIVFFGRLFGLSKAESKRRAAELAELVALTDKLRTPVRDLSGGMRQRTNLACALVHRPRLLLLDEPTVGVDPVLRRTLWDHFADLNAEGVTMLVTTHVMEEAERCHRVAMIASGRAIAVGAPNELRGRANAATLEDAYLAFSTEVPP